MVASNRGLGGAMIKFLVAALFAGSASMAHAAGWPPASDYVNIMLACSDSDDASNCNYTRTVWDKQYAAAIAGDYQGQRNVSFCLSTGCNKAIVENRILGCAWRYVIIASGHLQLDSTDTTNQRYFCGAEMIDDAGRQAAKSQSRTLLRMLKASH
jgi:hypothetical protein